MAQYIDKDALVAEIKKRRDAALTRQKNLEAIGQVTVLDEMIAFELNRIISYMDTLEVKEDNLLTEKKIEKELAEIYISIFDKKFGNKLPKLKGKQLAEFKNFINTCEQTFHIKYFDYHATQGKLFEKLALLWADWGKEHLSPEVKDVKWEEEINRWQGCEAFPEGVGITPLPKAMEIVERTARHFFELGLQGNNKAQKGEEV